MPTLAMPHSNSDILTLLSAIEKGSDTRAYSPALIQAAYGGLGSKYLAVGSPTALGIIDCNDQHSDIVRVHETLFGALTICSLKTVRSSPSIETCCAADIVCLSTKSQIDPLWFADATHLNVFDTGAISPGVQALLARTHLTRCFPDAPSSSEYPHAKAHGSLSDVICGRVSGRVGEEITCLLYAPPAG